ncbi:MAG: DUF2298 domain-containing protein [Candidatus Gottesmanbacteria bacterium]
MPMSDVFIVLQWWSVLFLVGAAAFPLTKRLFPGWYDKGYFFSKAVGFVIVSYLVYVAGTIRVAPFTVWTIYGAMAIVFLIGIFITQTRSIKARIQKLKESYEQYVFLFGLEEAIFFLLLILWSWVKAHEPSIRGLEKFMDYGFMQSILNSSYFPAPDMWWAGGSINYYYFGHLVTAVLTKLSGLSLGYTFNLMLATIFALTATMSFSIGYQLLFLGQKRKIGQVGKIIGGVLTAFLVTAAGNMQTIYAFTKGYVGEDVQPFWHLLWPLRELSEKIGQGMMTYWYPNATRFIPFSIHEFPSYSFVVSDVHGHVLSLPFVLLALGMLIHLFTSFVSLRKQNIPWGPLIWYGFLVGILLMTNALDGPIYGGLFAFCWFVFIIVPNKKHWKTHWWEFLYPVGFVAITAIITALPFLFFFNSFATGIGVNCPPSFLAGMKIGPFIFEEVEKCQRSPLWMMWLLWGFFWFTGAWLFITKIWNTYDTDKTIRRILKVFYLFGIGLIIFPEFFYVKDIYPAHFRSNTMFKLGYQAFIMWSVIAGYVITHAFITWKHRIINTTYIWLRPVFIFLLIPQLFLVSIYPIFSIRSNFGELKNYQEIWGFGWMQQEYPDNWKAIEWLKERMENNQTQGVPILVEADGDSYTDYNQISAFSGIPTIAGWAVHEWLWRGTYDTVSPRRDDIRRIYESTDIGEIEKIITAYNITYIIVGRYEREKFSQIQENVLDAIGIRVFTSGTTTIWETRKR